MDSCVPNKWSVYAEIKSLHCCFYLRLIILRTIRSVIDVVVWALSQTVVIIQVILIAAWDSRD